MNKDNDISWVAVAAALLLVVGLGLGIAAAVLNKHMLLELAGIIELSGIGWSVLATWKD